MSPTGKKNHLVHEGRSEYRVQNMRASGGLVATVVATVLLVAQRDHAQTDPDATRRLLLEQADQASRGGDHASALDLARRAGALRMTPSLRLFIAQEDEEIGDLAGAFGNADVCVHEVERDRAMHNREQILAACRSAAARLRGRVAYVTVLVAEPRPPGLHITMGGTALSDALLGVQNVVTPGPVAIVATADGRQTFRNTVTVTAGATAYVTMALAESTSTSTAAPAQATNIGPALAAAAVEHVAAPLALPQASLTVPTDQRACPAGTVFVPAGTFWMGSAASEGAANEHPQHPVTLTAFCIDRTEVTVAAYRTCVQAGACPPAPTTIQTLSGGGSATEFYSSLCNGARPDQDAHPINCVDWDNAATYCHWASGRLPAQRRRSGSSPREEPMEERIRGAPRRQSRRR